ncbi:MAG: GNAT family N-acetyltransferase [Novosphingobium sp.]
MSEDPLIRPVWNMLTGPQEGLALGDELARRIDPAFGPFAAARDQSPEALAALGALIEPGQEVWLVETELWPAPPGLTVARTAVVVQMVAQHPALLQLGDEVAELLGESDAAAMSEIALATKPGPWGSRTRLYGDFYGIREGARLAAMAGERMRPAPGLAELSGVCTWPDYRGQGLAAKLIRRVMTGFTARGDTPFLHSYAANTGANALYEKLGFVTRREMVVTVLERR